MKLQYNIDHYLNKIDGKHRAFKERLITHDTNGCHPIWALIFLLGLGGIGLGNNMNNNN